jgi:hypothetical protein
VIAAGFVPLRLLAIVVLCCLPSGLVSAGEGERAASMADFIDVCAAALLAPAELPAAKTARGLSEPENAVAPPGVDATLYASADGQRTVTITRHHFSDLDMASCLVSFPELLGKDELAALRRKLEAVPAVGRLEGELMEASPSLHIGTLKRPGNAPIVTVNVTAAKTVTTLVMNRWDIARGR